MKPSILWITDPWQTLDHPKDTTLRWIEECLALKVETHWCSLHDIHWVEQGLRIRTRKVISQKGSRTFDSFRMAQPKLTPADRFTRIVYRVDPPVDLKYLHPLQLLQLGIQDLKTCEIVNVPEVIFGSNEKMEATLLDGLMPKSTVSSSWDILSAFGRKQGSTVLKPLHQAQSKGVELLRWKSASDRARSKRLIKAATDEFTTPVLLQRFLPAIHQGEQRLWLLNGELIAVARKRPKSGEFKIDMDRGGSLVSTQLNAAEKRAAKKIGQKLRERRIRLAAVDLIDGFVTDHNFTSPGLIVQMEAITGKNLSRQIVLSLTQHWR